MKISIPSKPKTFTASTANRPIPWVRDSKRKKPRSFFSSIFPSGLVVIPASGLTLISVCHGLLT